MSLEKYHCNTFKIKKQYINKEKIRVHYFPKTFAFSVPRGVSICTLNYVLSVAVGPSCTR